MISCLKSFLFDFVWFRLNDIAADGEFCSSDCNNNNSYEICNNSSQFHL